MAIRVGFVRFAECYVLDLPLDAPLDLPFDSPLDLPLDSRLGLGSTLGSGLGAAYAFGGAWSLASSATDFAIIGDLGSLTLAGTNSPEGFLPDAPAAAVSIICRWSRVFWTSCPCWASV